MEQLSSPEELHLMSKIDFIVPLKQVGIITKSVLEAIQEFYQPRRIIVVTKKIEGEILKKLIPHWNVGQVECMDEALFFVRNYSLSFMDIIAEYDATRPGDQREAGWWIQQLIKLGAATQIVDISPTYVVWDGDLVPTRRWKLCSEDPISGRLKYHIAILQGESRSEFNTTQYANCMRALTGFTPEEPLQGGTFVAHHMVFQTRYVAEMLQLMAEKTGCTRPWPLMIMASSRKFYRFSEYKTYATFMIKMHPEEFNYHELSMFGEGGLRFREANSIVDDMLSVSKIKDGGLSFDQVRGYVKNNWVSLTVPGQCKPGYIQLDHVYGLAGFDLNMTPATVPAAASASLSCLFSNSSFLPFAPSSSSSTSSTSISSASSLPSCIETEYLQGLHSNCTSPFDNNKIATNMSLSMSIATSVAAPTSISLPVPVPVVEKKSFIHYMFPTKRPRFIVQR